MKDAPRKPLNRVVSRLPARFGRVRGLIAEGNIRITHNGTLRAKVLVFERTCDLRRFWVRKLRKAPLGRRCLGAVQCLSMYWESTSGKRRIEVDRRYFCIIGLCRRHLTIRIVSHEAVHAGFCYAKRKARSWWDAETKHFHEEGIAYPTGEIAAEIVGFLTREKLLPEK